jgi:catechol 2,3-dioxygenase-like lactoylglutathione lyase family enzyme
MIAAIESVTIAVGEMQSSVDLLEERLGLVVVGDARVSVGHLSAWHHPVHESVRLIELASDRQALGRVRLACVEDAGGERATAAERGIVPGPSLLDFRAASEPAKSLVMHGPAGLPLLCPSGPARPGPGHRLRSVWVVTADPDLAGRFYTNVLGFVPARDDEAPSVADRHLVADALGVPHGTALQVAGYRLANRTDAVVVVLHVPGLAEAQPLHSIGLTRSGIRLLTCACEDLDALATRLRTFGVEPLTPPQHVGLPSGVPGQVMVTRGPSQELFEFIETVP